MDRTEFRAYVLEYVTQGHCMPWERNYFDGQSFSGLLVANNMTCGSVFKISGASSGKETVYDLGNASTRWKSHSICIECGGHVYTRIEGRREGCCSTALLKLEMDQTTTCLRKVIWKSQVAGGGVLLRRLGGGLPQRHPRLLGSCSRFSVRYKLSF